jgi:hypothetical protein
MPDKYVKLDFLKSRPSSILKFYKDGKKKLLNGSQACEIRNPDVVVSATKIGCIVTTSEYPVLITSLLLQ